MWPNPQFPADLDTFTEELLNGKLHIVCIDSCVRGFRVEKMFLNYEMKYLW